MEGTLTKLFVYEYLTGGGIDPALAGVGSLLDLSALIVEGRAMRDALVKDLLDLGGVDVTFASSRFETVDPSRKHCRAMPGESITRFVARVSREHDRAWIIAPECDGLLLHLYDCVGTARWLGCAKEAIRTASSKSATAACLEAHGISVTPALEPGQLALAGHAHVDTDDEEDHEAHEKTPPRWVVKPDDGAGGLDTFVYDHAGDACAEYEARAAAGRNPVLQEWVDGEPLSLSLIVGEHDVELVSINRQLIGLPDSAAPGKTERVVEFSGVEVDRIDRHSAQGVELEKLARRVVSAVHGLRGFVGIDVVWHARRGPVVIEVNPRLTAAYAGLSTRLRRNLAADLLKAHGVLHGCDCADGARL
jgi:predicted ATP-grasp superfamily ATP-dependent carboligase